VNALEKGMAGGFLQTGTARVLQTLVESRENIVDLDRNAVLSFLSGAHGSGYSPQSGSITGILKTIGDEMSKTLADATTEEEGAIKDNGELVSAKSKEIAAHSQAIEEKSVRVGEVAVSAIEMKNDLSDTQEALVNDKKFLSELETGCSTKAAEWAERSKTRNEELVALQETIQFLNSDDALELFKKSIPSAAASFVQMAGNAAHVKARALGVLRAARVAASGMQRSSIDFIALALQGKKGGFETVIKMIDDMADVMKKEQQDDDHKVEYCSNQLDLADDKKKGLEGTVSNEESAAENADEAIATLTEELKALAAGISALDKSVAEASEQRKEEHTEFTESTALNSQAKDLLGVAKNRLNKFYNPTLYVAPAEPAAFVQQGDAPAPPPETFGAYEKKSGESSGVIALIDTMVKDLEKEITEAETSEKDAQSDYEGMMADAKVKRASDAKSVTEKDAAKASMESEAQAHKEEKESAANELAATAEYIHGLHAECDWIVENHPVRKEARAAEAQSLQNAKAVLSGADFALVQSHSSKRLRGA
jgi:chromosome segregation ATPase